MNLFFKKIMVPTVSAIAGGLAVVAVLKVNPTLQLKLNGNSHQGQKSDAIYKDIFKKQNGIQNNFDNLFEEEFFDRQDPFKRMKRMREQMEKQMGNFVGKSPSASNSFDTWFSDKFGGGGVYDVSEREDDGFIYYDIKIDDLNSSTIDAKVENGYVTITGTLEKRNENNRVEEKLPSQYFYKSTFNRTFQLPDNVNADKMQMTPEKGRIVLKFPKLNV